MIPVPTARQIRQCDEFTIRHEPVASIDLMERAAAACFRWLVSRYGIDRCFHCYVFVGNNGGDGLAIARMLHLSGYRVVVHQIHTDRKPSPDFAENKMRLLKSGFSSWRILKQASDLTRHEPDDVIVDAIFGTGLSKAVTGFVAQVIRHINHSGAEVVAVDMPSGLFADTASGSGNHAVIRAHHTLSFEFVRKAFLFAGCRPFTGEVHLLSIGLKMNDNIRKSISGFIIEQKDVNDLRRKRNPFSNKGDYGHALVIAGSYGMMGAAVLAARACVKSGAGLTTALIPACGMVIMQTALPEAMCKSAVPSDFESDSILHGNPGLTSERYTTIGIGPGIGRNDRTLKFLKNVMTVFKKPMVIDADALNLISENKSLIKRIPENSILTPHPKEFERLFGTSRNEFHRHEMQLTLSARHRIYIVLKGHHTCITTPDGKSFFNTTGNAGMAKGGSGDVLTGFLTGLLAQGYTSEQACIAGVYLHGKAGDRAIQQTGIESLTASDIIEELKWQESG